METPNVANVPGLVALSQDERSAVFSGGQFALPAGFDSTKYASRWVLDGPSVEEAKQDEVLSFAGVKAAGWQVYKVLKAPTEEEVEKAKKESKNLTPRTVPCLRAVGRNTYVLMFRPKELQKAVNQIYANQSRAMVNAEVDGETSAANVSDDPGILTNADMRRFDGRFQDAENVGGYLKNVGNQKTPEQAVTLNIG
jgi:hypothetical protein